MFADEDLHRHAAENFDQADALLFGRVTYEMMEAAWRSPARRSVFNQVTEAEIAAESRVQLGGGWLRPGAGHPGVRGVTETPASPDDHSPFSTPERARRQAHNG
jgi:hypothetical protein